MQKAGTANHSSYVHLPGESAPKQRPRRATSLCPAWSSLRLPFARREVSIDRHRSTDGLEHDASP